MKIIPVSFVCLALFLFSCTHQKNITGSPVSSLRFVDEYSLPYRMNFKGTVAGGFSGIDYSPSEKLYYIIADDRSDHNPARFYKAKIFFSTKGIDSVGLVSVTTLLQKNGQPYPNRKRDSLHVPDPEALRYNPKNNEMVWSSEGERIVRNGVSILNDPSINLIQAAGKLIDTFSLPVNMRMSTSASGPRQNGVFEALTFSDDFKTLYVCTEEPIYEDGDRAGLFDSSGWVRITKYDMNTKLPVAQYAYAIDPVVQEPISEHLYKVNGVTDILAVNKHQLLITERSFSIGRLGCNVRVYLADLSEAENIMGVPSLKETPPQKPLRKKLLLNMDKLGRLVDNVEGATFGPVLSNGKRSLLFVTDDNFDARQKTAFMLFEVE